MIIYKAININNRKVYIGQTNNLAHRIGTRLCRTLRGKSKTCGGYHWEYVI
jgi:hypothetical protein